MYSCEWYWCKKGLPQKVQAQKVRVDPYIVKLKGRNFRGRVGVLDTRLRELLKEGKCLFFLRSYKIRLYFTFNWRLFTINAAISVTRVVCTKHFFIHIIVLEFYISMFTDIQTNRLNQLTWNLKQTPEGSTKRWDSSKVNF